LLSASLSTLSAAGGFGAWLGPTLRTSRTVSRVFTAETSSRVKEEAIVRASGATALSPGERGKQGRDQGLGIGEWGAGIEDGDPGVL